jgi:hypothetical protein
MTKLLDRMDQAKEAVANAKLSDAEKQSRLQAIEKARGNLLAHADGLSKFLSERKQKARTKASGGELGAPFLGAGRATGSRNRPPDF